MQKITKLSLLILLLAVASSCGNTEKKDDSLSSKKANLEKLKAEQAKLDDKISGLEKDIAKLDTSAAAAEKAKLVSLATIDKQPFNHYLQLQGTVDNKNVSYVTPSGQGGR